MLFTLSPDPFSLHTGVTRFYRAGILQSLEKVDSKCIVHLAPGKFNCIARSDSQLGLQAYAHLKSEAAFENFTIESNNSNNVSFVICIETFVRAIKAATNAGELVMRLSKKTLGRTAEAIPCLTLDIDLQVSAQRELWPD